MKDFSFIQVIGTQRSGSNLLRLMLNQIDEIVAPHPPHILPTFMPLLSRYGNLEDPTAFSRLVDDVCTWIELNPVPWRTTRFNRSEVENRCASHTLVSILYACYQIEAENAGAIMACCKSMGNVHYMEQLEENGFRPYYIYLYRDGRDVALSFQKTIVGEKHFYHIAKTWKRDQEAAIAQLATIEDDRKIWVRYEHLIREPETVIRQICDLLGLNYSDRVTEYYLSEDSRKTASSGKMWQNVAMPVISDNSGKYKQCARPQDIRVFERVAGSTLVKLGYELMHPALAGLNGFDGAEIEQFNRINENLKLSVLNTADKNDLLKRSEQQNLYKRILMED